MILGYYVFLGSGDYHPPSTITPQWIFTWGLTEWKSFIDDLLLLDTNTLFIYLNGHKLPYKSLNYPELIDENHSSNEFLYELFSYIKDKGIQLIAVLTTTGHAGGFLQAHPESAIELLSVDVSIENTLVSFPEHIRKGKLSRKSGAAQLGHGVLCHNKPDSRLYAENILSEIMELYGSFFDGIALHPPESAYPCYCEQCCNQFLRESGSELRIEPINVARKFFISSYLKFQTDILLAQIKSKLTHVNLFTFSIPWLFEDAFEEISQYLPKELTIIEWDYNLSPDRLLSLPTRLQLYKNLGFKILFMPTAGFSFDPNGCLDEQINAIKTQLDIVEEMEVEGIAHFIGPKVSEYLVQTSRKSLTERHSLGMRSH